MNWLRTLAAVLVTALFLVIAVGDTVAQQPKTKTKTENKVDPKNIPDPIPGEVFDVNCPNCSQKLEVRDTMTTITCTKCGKELKVKKNGGDITLELNESSENKWKKPLLIGGGVLLVLGLIGVVLKQTVLAPAPVKKKKKKKRPVDEDDEDDRPRKKKRPVVEDEDEAPRKVKKKPRIVDDEE
ncbi:hypothetical protein BH11PLA2_BH11PLA2_11000 [soil metagenome]